MGSINSCLRRSFPCLDQRDSDTFSGEADTVRLQRKSTISMDGFPSHDGTYENFANIDVPTVMEGNAGTDLAQRLTSSQSLESTVLQRPLQQNRPSTPRPSEVKLSDQQQIEPNKSPRGFWKRLYFFKKSKTMPSLQSNSIESFLVENENFNGHGTSSSSTESSNRQDVSSYSPSRVAWKKCTAFKKKEMMPSPVHSNSPTVFRQNKDSKVHDTFAEITDSPYPQDVDRKSDIMPLRPAQLEILQMRNNLDLECEKLKKLTLDYMNIASLN